MTALSGMGKSGTLFLYLALIAIGLWGTYDWLVLDQPNKGAFVTPIAIWLLWVEFLSPNRDPDDPSQTP
jgi:hypothetical protein